MDDRRTRLETRTRALWKSARHASVGLEFALSVVIGYFLGRWVESLVGGAPYGGIVGICFGFAAGVRTLWRTAIEVERESSRG